MSITKTLLAGAAGTVLASGMAAASEPMKLSQSELDQVTAGFFFSQVAIGDSDLFGLSGLLRTSSQATGSETVDVTNETNFSIKINAYGYGSSTGTVRGGFLAIGQDFALSEGVGVLGGMTSLSETFPESPF